MKNEILPAEPELDQGEEEKFKLFPGHAGFEQRIGQALRAKCDGDTKREEIREECVLRSSVEKAISFVGVEQGS